MYPFSIKKDSILLKLLDSMQISSKKNSLKSIPLRTSSSEPSTSSEKKLINFGALFSSNILFKVLQELKTDRFLQS
jgi:hypothetical protein